MEIAEILRRLEWFHGRFEKEAVEAAVARREEIIPELLRVFDDAVNRAAELDDKGEYMAHLYAMYLLAQFREPRAYPIVVRFASLPGDLLDSLCGDFITDGLGKVLASVCGGDLAGIQALIENEDVHEWVRSAAMGSLVTLMNVGQKGRDEIVSYFAGLFRGGLVRQPSPLWGELVNYACDLYPAELLDDIKRAYAERLVDPFEVGLADVQSEMSRGKESVLARLADNRHHYFIENTVDEMGRWSCFHKDRPDHEFHPPAAPPPIQRTTPKTKIGRNDPCPCGSAKKFKKCCGA